MNESGIVGPVYVPGITSCYACNENHDGQRYNRVSPTFSPIVTNVVSKMMLVFLDIILKNHDNLSQYYFFNLYTARWKEVNYETKDRCIVCGKAPHYDTLRLKTMVKYSSIALVGCAMSWLSNHSSNYIYNYLLVLVLIIVFYKQATRPGFIFNCSIILVTINTVSYLFSGNVALPINGGVILYLQEMALVVVTICIMVTIISFVWYILGVAINKIGEVLYNVFSSRCNKRI